MCNICLIILLFSNYLICFRHKIGIVNAKMKPVVYSIISNSHSISNSSNSNGSNINIKKCLKAQTHFLYV